MRFGNISRKQSQERGQTIALVALTIVTLLAMAALAIDVVTLYVAKGEVQRAADAAALVAAKAFVDSGVTSDPANTSLQTLATNMATAGINAILPENKIAGAAPVLANAPSFDFTTHPGNPQVTVTLQRTGLPIFFARIWRSAAATVTASAKAEAYNPSNSQTQTGNYIPIKPKCVKPLLVPNKNPNSGGAPFITVATGVVAAGLVGQPITLNAGCQSGPPGNPCVPSGVPVDPAQGNFLPATTASSSLCPSCEGGSAFEQCIECCDLRIYSCGATTTPQPAEPPPRVDTVITKSNVRSLTRTGVRCLINSPSQDTIDVTNLTAGTGPAQITAGSGPQAGNLVSTSRSVATFPIIDTPVPIGGNAVVIGFLQAFVDNVNSVGNVSVTMHILNVVGCGNSPGTVSPVTPGSISPIPVRLISQ